LKNYRASSLEHAPLEHAPLMHAPLEHAPLMHAPLLLSPTALTCSTTHTFAELLDVQQPEAILPSTMLRGDSLWVVVIPGGATAWSHNGRTQQTEEQLNVRPYLVSACNNEPIRAIILYCITNCEFLLVGRTMQAPLIKTSLKSICWSQEMVLQIPASITGTSQANHQSRATSRNAQRSSRETLNCMKGRATRRRCYPSAS
jgi:hypothetical protein